MIRSKKPKAETLYSGHVTDTADHGYKQYLDTLRDIESSVDLPEDFEFVGAEFSYDELDEEDES